MRKVEPGLRMCVRGGNLFNVSQIDDSGDVRMGLGKTATGAGKRRALEMEVRDVLWMLLGDYFAVRMIDDQ